MLRFGGVFDRFGAVFGAETIENGTETIENGAETIENDIVSAGPTSAPLELSLGISEIKIENR